MLVVNQVVSYQRLLDSLVLKPAACDDFVMPVHCRKFYSSNPDNEGESCTVYAPWLLHSHAPARECLGEFEFIMDTVQLCIGHDVCYHNFCVLFSGFNIKLPKLVVFLNAIV